MFRRVLSTFVLIAVALTLTACPTGTTSGKKPSKAAVQAGSNVKTELGVPGLDKPATITFASVQTAGDVNVDAATGPALPSGGEVKGSFIEISTTAKFDKATACFEDPSFTSASKVLHKEGGKWVNVTSSATAPQVCGSFTSFSPVFIGGYTCPSAERLQAAANDPDVVDFLTVAGCTLARQSATPSPVQATPTPVQATPTAAQTTPTPVQATPTPAQATPTAQQQTEAPTQQPTAQPTQQPTQQPTPQPTPPPTTAPPTPTPTPAFSAIPRQPTPTKLGIWGRVTAPDGSPVGGACVTLGPPIRCFTFTSNQQNAADTGYFSIDLDALAAPSGSQWDFYVITGGTYTKVAYAQYYSGKFVVSGVVQKDVKLQ